MRTASQIISWVFLPLFMPVYALLIAMYLPSESESAMQTQQSLFHINDAVLASGQTFDVKLYILAVYMIFSVLAPGFSLLMFKRQKRIASVELDTREERGFPIAVTVIYCAMLGLFIWFQVPRDNYPSAIFALPWAGVLASSIAGIINRYEKISLHAMGAGMLFGFLVAYFNTQLVFNFDVIILAVLVGGMVMSARMYLEKHNLRESVSGYLLGFLTVFLVLTFFPS